MSPPPTKSVTIQKVNATRTSATESSTNTQAENTKEIYARVFIASAFTMLSRILGLVRELSLAYRFGASRTTDAWQQAFRLPNVLRRITGEHATTYALVPVYVQERAKSGAAGSRQLAAQALHLILWASGILTVLGMVFHQPLTRWLSPGFVDEPEVLNLTANMTFWLFPYLVLISIAAWAMAVLHAEGRFGAAAAAPVLFNLAVIAAILWPYPWLKPAIMLVVMGAVLGGGLQVLIHIPWLRQVKAPLLPRMGWSQATQKMGRLLGYSMASGSVYQVQVLLLGVLASYLPQGNIFLFNNALRLTELASGLFTIAVTTATQPTINHHLAREDDAALGNTLRLSWSAGMYCIIPASIALAVLAPSMISVLFLHGAFTYEDVLLCATSLRLLTLSMPATTAFRIMTPIAYAYGIPKSVMFAVSMGTLFLVLGAPVILQHGLWGLSLSFVLVQWIEALILLVCVRSKTKHLGGVLPWNSLSKQLLAACIMGLFLWPLHQASAWDETFAPLPRTLSALGMVLGGGMVYLGITYVLKEEESRNWLGVCGRAGRAVQRMLVRLLT